MRPDPHKKKYTGPRRKDGRKGADKNKKTDKQDADDRCQDAGASMAGASAEYRRKTDSDNVTNPSVGVEQDESVERSFSRRKLQSNWDRYEDVRYVDDMEPVEPLRGEDFQVLLKQAGDALTQFRFQDEVDWETEGSEPDIMALNCQDLAAALRCVPLHVVLGIEDIVPSDIASQYEEEASLYRSTYKPPDRTEPNTDDTDLVIESSICDDVINEDYYVCDELEDEKKNIPYKRKAKGGELGEEVTSAPVKNDTASLKDNASTETLEDHGNPEVDKQNVEKRVNTGPPAADERKPEAENIDDELEFLLSLESPKTSDVPCDDEPTIEKQVPQKDLDVEKSLPPEQSKKQENLEDWLDSVLDD